MYWEASSPPRSSLQAAHKELYKSLVLTAMSDVSYLLPVIQLVNGKVSLLYVQSGEKSSFRWLIACYGGLWGTASPAERLAKKLRATIIAAAGIVCVDDEGDIFVTSDENLQSKDDLSQRDLELQEDYWYIFDWD